MVALGLLFSDRSEIEYCQGNVLSKLLTGCDMLVGEDIDNHLHVLFVIKYCQLLLGYYGKVGAYQRGQLKPDTRVAVLEFELLYCFVADS